MLLKKDFTNGSIINPPSSENVFLRIPSESHITGSFLRERTLESYKGNNRLLPMCRENSRGDSNLLFLRVRFNRAQRIIFRKKIF